MGKNKEKTLTKDGGFRHLFEAMPDGLIIVDSQGIIVQANSRIETLFGYSHDALVGQLVEILIPEDRRRDHAAYRQDFAKSPGVHMMGKGQQLTGLRADGTEFPVEVGLSPLETEDGGLLIASIRDVSIQRKTENNFRNLLDAAPDAMMVVNQAGIIQLVNFQVEELLGFARDELVGKSMEMLVPHSAREAHSTLRQRYHNQPYIRSMGAGLDLYAVHKDGRDIPVEIGLSPVMTEDGMVIIAALRDFSKQKRLNDRLSVLSITDQLTGLFNRRGLNEVGGKLRAIAKRTDGHLMLVMADVDHLKEINDRFGHTVGDQALCDVAAVLLQSVRESDVIARWGGDEFLVLVLEQQAASPNILVERINRNLENFHKEQGRKYPLSISIGYAVGDSGKDDFEGLIEVADRHMYKQKEQRRSSPN